VPWPLNPYRPSVQLEHAATFDAVEYFPAAHAVQLLAPVPVPVSVREPALHAMQLVWSVLPWYVAAAHGAHAVVEAVLDWPAAHAVQLDAPTLSSVLVYDPTLQLEHAATFDAVEYFPAAHAVQLLAPVPVPVFVCEPAVQLEQAATFDTVEYCPAAHAMQLLPPAFTPVSVLDPAGHTVQLAVVPAPALAYDPAGHGPLHSADVPWPLNPYRPAVQLKQAATFEDVEYFPAAHAMQLLAPVPVPMFVSEPAAQAMHEAEVPAPADAYEAAGHAPLHAADVPWPLRAYRPALQSEHAATFDAVEYFPAAHAVQLLAPLLVPVFVREPALHAMQLVWPVLPWYWAAAQLVHAIVEAVLDWPAAPEYCPAAHAMHDCAPISAVALIT
jgi:hypothetical protein